MVTKAYGFKECCDFVGIIALMYSIIYYIVADGKSAIKLSKWSDN